VDSLEKVIEKLATTEKTTIAIAREEGGKIRVTSGSWDGEKVILKQRRRAAVCCQKSEKARRVEPAGRGL
jgi:hypothetical protein